MSNWIGKPIDGSSQAVAYTGTAAQSTAIGGFTMVVRLVATTAAFVKFGANPTATTSDMYLAAGREEYFNMLPGNKISAIQAAAGGTLYITEMSR